MLSKIATQKEAEHHSRAALESVPRLNASRAAGGGLGCQAQPVPGILVCLSTAPSVVVISERVRMHVLIYIFVKIIIKNHHRK